jgi:hypothetical protein
MLPTKIAPINKVGFTILLTSAGLWLASVAFMPGATDVAESVHIVTYEELLQTAQLEYPATVQADF